MKLNRSILLSSLIAIASVALLIPSISLGSRGSMTLAELTVSSEIIVLGVVTAVNSVGEDVVATVHVKETWKGQVTPKIEYDARHTWVCDTSDARVGETAILFFVHRCPGGMLALASWGDGRLVVNEIDGVDYIGDRVRTLQVMDEMPIKWRFVSSDIPEPWAKLDDVKAFVKWALRLSAQSWEPPNNPLQLTAGVGCGVESRGTFARRR